MQRVVMQRTAAQRAESVHRSVEQSLHRRLYLSLQWMRGRPVGGYMRCLQARERLDRAAYAALHDRALEEALSHAHATVPLYSSARWRAALAGSPPTRLAAWPVLDRHTVRTRAAELHSRSLSPGIFHRHSSASTGEPLHVAWNPHAAAWGWANEYRAMLWHGVPPGARTLLMWGSGHPLQDWVKNCRVFLTRELTPARLDEAVEYLMTERPDLCAGLPSALTLLARHLRERYPDTPGPLVPFVKLGGEQVYPFQRQELTQHLGARIIETYGCTEVGPIAAECPAGSMHVLADNVHVEIFRGEEPVADGEFGELVVTSLCNRAMPLVRCRIGDSARLAPEPCVCGRPLPVLTDLIGRASDLFLAADGRAVHGSAIGQRLQSLLADAPQGTVRQVLFQQIDPLRWKVLIEVSGSEAPRKGSAGYDPTLDPGWVAKLAEMVRASFGQECSVEIERVPLVPREPSGKFRYYRPAGATPMRAQAPASCVDGP